MIAQLTKAARRQEASMLLNWMLAMAPLELPICKQHLFARNVIDPLLFADIFLELATLTLDIECEFTLVILVDVVIC